MNRTTSIALTLLLAAGSWNEVANAPASGDLGKANRSLMIVIPRLAIRADVGTDFSQAPWSRAAQLTGFLEVGSGNLATCPTRVGLAYDREALWVGFRCEGQSGGDLKADVTNRDEPVWRDDSVELLIRASETLDQPFQFVVNSTGAVYDAKGLDKSWNATWTARASTDSQGFSVVMVIPFAELKAMSPPPPGQVWAVNFCRNCRSGKEKEQSSWSPVSASFQEARSCGWVEFGGSRVQPVRFARVDAVEIGKNLLRVEASPAVRYRLTATDDAGARIPLSEGQVPADGAIAFRLDNDRIRQVALAFLGKDGHRLAQAGYPMASPAVSARVLELQTQFDEVRGSLDRFAEKARQRALAVLSEVRSSLQEAAATVSDPDRHTAENWNRLAATVAQLELKLDGPTSYARTLARFPNADFAVGLESPMQKIMIRGYPFVGWFDHHYDLALARNEHEGFQVVVMPFHSDLRNVTVSVSSLVGTADGEALRGETEVSLVGHVDVADNTRYKVEHHGWWPDPLLDFQKSCDVRAGEHVAFWIDVATQADTRPGDYQGRVTIVADGCDPIEIGLNVHVWDFELLDGTHLRNAFTYNEGPVGRFYPDRWDKEMRYKYYDLILDHRLNIDHLYRRTPPDVSVLEYARTKGQNAFNVGGVFRHGGEDREKENLKYLSEIKGKGLFPYAYVYGFDEVKPEKFPEVRAAFARIHERYPGLKTMTTAIDHSYGRETGLRDVVDIWVPLTDWYDLNEARELRAEGRKVWWYICVVPEHPYANWFVEYPAIEARLLLGAMSYKYQVDGFLYYLINLWTGNKRPITSGPYTKWDPGSLVNEKKGYTANGDGSLICPGPDGPLSTIRLENIRDGFEDYEYMYLLAEQAERIRRLPADPPRQMYLERVAVLLTVPSSVVRNLTEYTREPEVVYGFRRELAEAILEGKGLLRR